MSKLVRYFACLSPGLYVVLYAGWILLSQRNPQATWLHPLGWVFLVIMLLMLISVTGRMEMKGGIGKQEGLLALLTALCACLIWYFRERPWAVMAAGVVAAIYIRGLGKLRGRSVIIAAAGWLVSGLAASLVDWPYWQKFEVAAVLGGTAMVLQDGWRLIGTSRESRPPHLLSSEE